MCMRGYIRGVTIMQIYPYPAVSYPAKEDLADNLSSTSFGYLSNLVTSETGGKII